MARITVIDDSDDTREVFYYMLRDAHEVTMAANAEEAFELFRNQPPDIILMDISLPGLSGVDALQRIRADGGLSRVPVIAVTAHAMQGDRERYLKAGFDHYITKPVVDVAGLLDVVNRFLA
jgi:CheY-like chemotaxis protein